MCKCNCNVWRQYITQVCHWKFVLFWSYVSHLWSYFISVQNLFYSRVHDWKVSLNWRWCSSMDCAKCQQWSLTNQASYWACTVPLSPTWYDCFSSPSLSTVFYCRILKYLIPILQRWMQKIWSMEEQYGSLSAYHGIVQEMILGILRTKH